MMDSLVGRTARRSSSSSLPPWVTRDLGVEPLDDVLLLLQVTLGMNSGK